MTKEGRRPPFRVSHVVFDIDGTLIDFVGAHVAGLEAAARRTSEATGRLVTADEIRAAQRTASAELRALGSGQVDARAEGFRRALASLGCIGTEIDAVVEAYNDARTAGLEPYPDVVPTIEALVARGFTLVAASNGNAAMASHAIFEHFAATWLADEVGVSKPDPAFFLGALDRVGATPEVALMVGDRVDNDYMPAQSVGMAAVLIDRRARNQDADIVSVTALTELPALLERA